MVKEFVHAESFIFIEIIAVITALILVESVDVLESCVSE